MPSRSAWEELYLRLVAALIALLVIGTVLPSIHVDAGGMFLIAAGIGATAQLVVTIYLFRRSSR